MAKKTDKPAPSGAGKGMRPGTLAGEHANTPEAPPDPLAGKSDEDKKAALEAAAKADEARKPVPVLDAKARLAARQGPLVVDLKVKAEALAIIKKLRAADADVAAARIKRDAGEGDAGHLAVVAARHARAALKKDLSGLYLRAPDSVQAAETEVAAGK